MSESPSSSRGKRTRRRKSAGSNQTQVEPAALSGLTGGRYLPLDRDDLPKIDTAVRAILSDVGMAEAPQVVVDQITRAGGEYDAEGRLHFSLDLIETALEGMVRNFVLCGQDPTQDLHLGTARVHVGSGGAAPLIRDLDSGEYRESTLRDLYDAARLVDSLEHLHFFSRSLVARDMPDPRALDLNTAYACLAGTRKHVFAAATEATNVAEMNRQLLRYSKAYPCPAV